MQYTAQFLLDSVDTRQFFVGLPQSPPFVLNPPIANPQLAQLLPQITGFVLYVLQARATSNPVRALHYLECKANNWNNPVISMTVALAADLADMSIASENRPLEYAISNGAEYACAYISAKLAVETGLVQQLPHLQTELYRLQGEYNHRIQAIADLQRRRTTPVAGVQGYGQPSGSYPSGYAGNAVQTPTDGFKAFGMSNCRNDVFTSPNQPRSTGYLGHHQYSKETEMMPAPTVQEPKMRNPFKPIQGTPKTESKPTRSEPSSQFRPLPTIKREVDLSQFESTSTTTEVVNEVVETQSTPETKPAHDDILPAKPENPEPFEYVECEDGSVIVPAVRHPEYRQQLPVNAIRQVYDVSDWVLFYCIDPKSPVKVKEVLQARSSVMDYMRHELDLKTRYLVEDTLRSLEDKVSVPNWEMAKGFVQHPELPIAANAFYDSSFSKTDIENTEITDIPVVRIEQRIQTVRSLKDAVTGALENIDTNLDGEDVFECYYAIANHLPITGENFNNVIKHVKEQTTYTGIQNAIKDIGPDFMELGFQSATVQKAVNEAVTAEVNRVIRQQLSIRKWSIDSFVEDYPDLIRLLKENFGDRTVEMFESTATDTAQSVKNLSKGRAISLGYRCSILVLPWQYASLNIDINDGGVIDPENAPNVYEILKDIFLRTHRDNLRMDRHLLLTKDDRLLEVRKGLFSDRGYMLFPIDLENE